MAALNVNACLDQARIKGNRHDSGYILSTG